MGILSFLTGGSGRSEPANPDDNPSRGGPAAEASGPAREKAAAGPSAADEPGSGIADVEPLGGSTRPGTDSDPGAGSRVDPMPADWWRSAGEDSGSLPGAGSGSAGDIGQWDLGALLEAPAPAGLPLEVGPPDPGKTLELKPKIVDALGTVFDPEIPVNIYELGLIYEVVVDAGARVLVRMTLTSPACPSAQQLPSEVQYKVKAVPGVADAAVEVVWDPPWSKDMMSDAAKLSLGIW